MSDKTMKVIEILLLGIWADRLIILTVSIFTDNGKIFTNILHAIFSMILYHSWKCVMRGEK